MGFLIFTIYLIARLSPISLHVQLFSFLVAAKQVTYSVLEKGKQDGKYYYPSSSASIVQWAQGFQAPLSMEEGFRERELTREMRSFQSVRTEANWKSKQWRQPTFLFSFNPSVVPLEPSGTLPSPLEEMLETQCQDIPSGVGIPAFQPGLAKTHVLQMLGTPTGIARGYWPNTRAVFYELIPNEVSLGFLFDRQTERIRQTEASFTAGTDPQTVLLTLNGMLGCQLNDQIEQGLQKVWQREARQYSFRLGSLEGVIERQRGDRLYIGIWEEDLH
ncbi:MAG TPA: hypothetical protein V6C95_07415 [Coleofasciculaceae cyanobacterium]